MGDTIYKYTLGDMMIALRYIYLMGILNIISVKDGQFTLLIGTGETGDIKSLLIDIFIRLDTD